MQIDFEKSMLHFPSFPVAVWDKLQKKKRLWFYRSWEMTSAASGIWNKNAYTLLVLISFCQLIHGVLNENARYIRAKLLILCSN